MPCSTRRRRSRVAHPSSALVSTSNAGAFAGRTAIPALPVRCSSRRSRGRSRRGSTSSQPTRRTWSRSSPPTETTSSAGPAVASSSPSCTTVPRTGWGRCSTTSAGSTTRPASSSPRSTPSSALWPHASAIRRTATAWRSRGTRVGKTLRAARTSRRRDSAARARGRMGVQRGRSRRLVPRRARGGVRRSRPVRRRARQARLAIPLLERDDPSFAEDAGRTARLDDLARG